MSEMPHLDEFEHPEHHIHNSNVLFHGDSSEKIDNPELIICENLTEVRPREKRRIRKKKRIRLYLPKER